MATKKQQRRRYDRRVEATQRREADGAEGERAPAKSAPKSRSASRESGRRRRPPRPPSLKRAATMGMIMGVVLVVMFSVIGKKSQSSVQLVLTALAYGAALSAANYGMDAWVWRRANRAPKPDQ